MPASLLRATSRGMSPLRRRLVFGAAGALAVGACSEPPVDDELLAPAATAGHAPRPVDAPDLHAGAILLPGLIDNPVDGPFIGLLHAIEQVYAQGRISVEVGPTKRVFDAIARGVCDLGLPTIRLPGAGARLPYRHSSTPFGTVSFVLYSHRARPVARADIEAFARGECALRVEGPELDWGFPVQPFSTFDSALRKVDAGRIDAFLWAQEEADQVLRGLRLGTIRRSLYGTFGDVFLLPLGPRGDFVDGVLSAAIGKLRAGGRLDTLYRRIHGPWDPWQP